MERLERLALSIVMLIESRLNFYIVLIDSRNILIELAVLIVVDNFEYILSISFLVS